MVLEYVPPQKMRLNLRDEFDFSCHDEIDCFNKCCGNKHLPLTPYDVLRLKAKLNIHSDTFLTNYTLYDLHPDTGFPLITIKMGDSDDKPCPFVGPKGCSVYDDRPMACRLYPLGRISGKGVEGEGAEEIFFLLETPNCLGREIPKRWRVKDWVENQCLLKYIKMKDMMLDLVFHPKRDRRTPLSNRQIQNIIVAWYSLDVFRDFVFETNFVEIYQLDENICQKIRKEDEALLSLGFKYLSRSLFG